MKSVRGFVFVVGLAATLVVPACNSGEISSLRAQVSDLRTKVEQLTQQTETLKSDIKDAHSTEDRLRTCLADVEGVARDLAGSVQYLASNRPFGSSTFSFHSSSCRHVMKSATVSTLRTAVGRASRTVDQVTTNRLFGPTPSTTTTPSSATAICNDGTYSYSQHASGTCSWHGGVRTWLNYPGN